MNRLSLTLRQGGGALLVLLLGGAIARSDGDAPQPCPEHQACATDTSSSGGELEGFALMLRVYFKPLPATMPGSQEDSPEMIALGRKLYFERGLSHNKTQSCNDCHRLDGRQNGVDDRPTSTGADGTLGKRNAPTVINAGFQLAQFWDGRAPDLAEQAKGPVLNPIEMGMRSPEDVVKRLKGMAGYPQAFAAAFPRQAEPLTYDNVARAIAAFERTLIAPARFDRYLRGDQTALTRAEERGLHRFVDTGCVDCHSSYTVGGRLLQRLGVCQPYTNQQDAGRREVTRREADRLVFKVPMLREVTRTAPYFHDGQVSTLPEAVRLMARLQLDVVLDQGAIDEIVTFLHALEGERPLHEAAPLARRIQSEFDEEAQVAAKYAAFAAQAKTEGYPQAARLFQALLAAENLHAEFLLRLMNGVNRTAENLKAGADYEAYLAGKVLPAAAEQAGQERDAPAERLFRNLVGAGVRHEKILRQARERLVSGRDADAQPIWVCPQCGTVLAGSAPDTCPVCAVAKAKFLAIP